jgi:hypothetical protein
MMAKMNHTILEIPNPNGNPGMNSAMLIQLLLFFCERVYSWIPGGF